MEITLAEAQTLYEYTRHLRRDFHRYPELGFQEVRTAGIVARELNALGLEVSTGVAQTGVVALLEGSKPGPVILLRFDMDALPIQEETGAEYASQHAGVMHACGHDGHTAIGLTVARLLNDHRAELAGTIKLVFQPAEEGLGGAEAMIAAGVLADPRPDAALALHLWNEKPLGWAGISPGPVMAAAEIFRVRLEGRGGHAALPHQTIDPVVAAAQIISALQTISARNVSPLNTAVVSVTSVHGGDAFNIIPSQVEMKGTIRTFEADVRQQVLERFRTLVEGIADAFGCRAEMDLEMLAPAVVNDGEIAEQVARSALEGAPDLDVARNYRSMVSEDMALMLQQIPGCFFFVGSANPERGLDAPHHHPRFDIDEAALPYAAGMMAAAAARLLKP